MVTPIQGLDKPGKEYEEREFSEMHEQQFRQLSHINVSSLLLL
jgi:hypothetical protein